MICTTHSKFFGS